LNDSSLCFIPASDLAALLIMCSVINGSAGWTLCTHVQIEPKQKSMQICTQSISDDLNLSTTLSQKALHWPHIDSIHAVLKAEVETDGSAVKIW